MLRSCSHCASPSSVERRSGQRLYVGITTVASSDRLLADTVGMPSPLISVVIPCYGRPERLRQLLKQLASQDLPQVDFEVVVVDDGSPAPIDITGPARELPEQLRVLRTPNRGPARARNAGAAVAHSPLLLFIDDDMSIPTDFLRVHREVQEQVSGGLVTVQFDWAFDGSGSFQKWYEQRVREWEGQRRGLKEGDILLVPPQSCTTANLSLPLDLFRRAGGFSERFRNAGCEDQDLALRLAAEGVKSYLTCQTRAVHMDGHATLPAFCARQRRGAVDTVLLVARQLARDPAYDLPDVAITAAPLSRRDDLSALAKKLARSAVASRWVSAAAFAAAALLDDRLPEPVLSRGYDVIIASHVQSGWREGLRAYGDAAAAIQAEALSASATP